ncbi:hypothetical protein [Dactylosporangium sp. CA-139066]|uniref:hypothetical protein n=1 Tax=Dactylosporangium sp. CA-139066 TaxID=3239930 RepID=UPI003D910F17
MPRPEMVPPPAADAVTFRPAFWPAFGFGVAIFLATWAVLLLAVALTPWATTGSGWWLLAVDAVAGSLVYATTFAGLRRLWCRDWVRVSSAGLELVSRGRAPVLLRWPAVGSVRLVRRWATPTLVVTPAGPDGAPLTVAVWLMRPGRPALLAALQRHRPAMAQDSTVARTML